MKVRDMSNAKHKVNMKNTNSELSTTDVNASRSGVADVSNIWGMSPLERQRKQFLKLSISPSANLVLRPDVIYDDAVLIGLVKSADVLLLDEDATPLAAHVSDNQLPSAERYSIAFFLDPNPTARVEVLETCIDADNPAKYPPVSGAEYLKQRLDASYEFLKEGAP